MKAIQHSLILALFLFLSFQVNGQEINKSTDIVGFTQDQTFDHLKQFALENDYFIKKLDRAEGFIQLGFLSRTNNLFSSGYKLSINVLLNTINENDCRITLQIYMQEATTRDLITTYEDKGMIKSEKGYSDLLSLNKKYMDRQRE
ncbi:hypothetical protein [Sphingobacterium mizutaii]|uniref:hypothetical protein n=1 Tax=Sphingobacterium mizutaii TaxID=1010 RepID=UPI0016259EC1|nr:hypothetical protein [Sphingobacterium mizutaii]